MLYLLPIIDTASFMSFSLFVFSYSSMNLRASDSVLNFLNTGPEKRNTCL